MGSEGLAGLEKLNCPKSGTIGRILADADPWSLQLGISNRAGIELDPRLPLTLGAMDGLDVYLALRFRRSHGL